MKKTLFFPLLTAALFSTAAASAQTQMTRQTRFEGQNITGIAAGNNFDVEIYQSDKTSASIEIPAELEKKLIFNIDGNGVVTLGLTGNFLSKKQDDLKAKIYLKNLKSLKASSNAEIKAMTPFTAASVVIDLSSSGKIDDLELTASERVVIDAKSSGEIDATITTPLLRADLTSSADGEIVHNGAQGRTDHQRQSRRGYRNHQQRERFPRRELHYRQSDAQSLFHLENYGGRRPDPLGPSLQRSGYPLQRRSENHLAGYLFGGKH